MKTIIATKMSDGWLVEITDKRTIPSYSEVITLIKQENLKPRTKTKAENEEIIKVFAD